MTQLLDEARKTLDDLTDHILDSRNETVRKAVRTLAKELGDREKTRSFVQSAVPEFLKMVEPSAITAQEFDQMVADNIDELRHMAHEMKKVFVFRCELVRNEKDVYRDLAIPAAYSWASFAYCVMAAFRCEGEHLFEIERDGMVLRPAQLMDRYGEYTDAGNVLLAECGLRKGSKAVLTYDFGDNYEISCRIVKTNTLTDLSKEPDAELLDGKGYGILEDEHYALEHYFATGDGDGQDLTFLKEFDLKAEQKALLERADDLFVRYEYGFGGGAQDDGYGDPVQAIRDMLKQIASGAMKG